MVPIIVWFPRVFTQEDLSRKAQQQAAYIDIAGELVECDTKGKGVKSFRTNAVRSGIQRNFMNPNDRGSRLAPRFTGLGRDNAW